MTLASKPRTAPPWSLSLTIQRHLTDRADAPALSYGERTLTYGDLDKRSSQVAQGLISEGVGAQERVAFLDKNSLEYFEVLFGGAKINAVNVGVNWRLSPREMQYVINDSGAKLLFVSAEFLPQLQEMEAGLTSVRKIVLIGESDGYQSYEDWLSSNPADNPGVEPEAEDVAMQLYTSGTTGMPKGAMLTNTNLGNTTSLGERWRFDKDSVNLIAMPLFHIGGSGWALVGLWFGCHSVLLREFVPDDCLRVMEERRITNAFLVPAVLQFLAAVPGAADRDYSALRAIVYGASPISDEHLKRAIETFGCEFIQVYGLTESTGAITELPFSDHNLAGPRTGLLRSAGRPYPWVEIRIVDADSGQDVAAGTVGEVWVRSAQTMKGYWNRPNETREVYAGDWLKTGDAGYQDAEGYVYLTDRVKDMIVSGGENIYPAEVENVLCAHPDIADVAVIGVPDAKWGEAVKAIVVPKPDRHPDPDAIISFAREGLAKYKCPSSVDFADALPRNPSGKILKKLLREPYWKDQERRVN